MIPSIHKQGSSTRGLLNYLYGKGTREEHVDPHLVASFDDMAPDPGRDLSSTKEDLQRLLDQPLHLLDADQRPDQHVWHCSVRAARTDRILSDEEWGDIARRIVAATGIDSGGPDGAGCRWAAVRHADDHIHIIATLVREDGRRPNHHRSGQRAQTEARLIEADYDLHRVTPGDGTAAKRPTSAERHKAERQGRERTVREELRETVRGASAGAASTDEFFDRLAADGLLIRKRIAPSGDLLGYKVALPGDRNKDDEPVFYAGSTLAPDLSLPRIRERWSLQAEAVSEAGSSGSEPVQPALPQVTHPAFARRRAAAAGWQALLIIDHGDDGMAAAQIAAASEVLDALAKTSAAHTRAELREAAFVFERASRSHIRAARGHDHALRQAAHDLVHSGPALGRGEDGATTAMVIDMAIFLAIAAANWHAKRHHSQQAAAAQQAVEHLRTAYQAAAAPPHRRPPPSRPADGTAYSRAASRSPAPGTARARRTDPGRARLARLVRHARGRPASGPRPGRTARRSHPPSRARHRRLHQRRPRVAPAPQRPPARRTRKPSSHFRPRWPTRLAGTPRHATGSQGGEPLQPSALTRKGGRNIADDRRLAKPAILQTIDAPQPIHEEHHTRMTKPDFNPWIFALLCDSDLKRRDDTGTWSHRDGRPFSKEEQALADRATHAELEELSAQHKRYIKYVQAIHDAPDAMQRYLAPFMRQLTEKKLGKAIDLMSKDELAEFNRLLALADERIRPFTPYAF